MGAGRQQRDGNLDGSSSKYAHPLGAPWFWCLERLASGESHDPSAAITLAFSPGGGYALPGPTYTRRPGKRSATRQNPPPLLLNIFEED